MLETVKIVLFAAATFMVFVNGVLVGAYIVLLKPDVRPALSPSWKLIVLDCALGIWWAVMALWILKKQ